MILLDWVMSIELLRSLLSVLQFGSRLKEKGGNLEKIKFSLIDLTGALLQDPPWNLSGLCLLELRGFLFFVF